MHSPWLSWVYLYGVGGSLFFASILMTLRTGAANRSLWTDQRLLGVLLGGITLAAATHAIWIVVATR